MSSLTSPGRAHPRTFAHADHQLWTLVAELPEPCEAPSRAQHGCSQHSLSFHHADYSSRALEGALHDGRGCDSAWQQGSSRWGRLRPNTAREDAWNLASRASVPRLAAAQGPDSRFDNTCRGRIAEKLVNPARGCFRHGSEIDCSTCRPFASELNECPSATVALDYTAIRPHEYLEELPIDWSSTAPALAPERFTNHAKSCSLHELNSTTLHQNPSWSSKDCRAVPPQTQRRAIRKLLLASARNRIL